MCLRNFAPLALLPRPRGSPWNILYQKKKPLHFLYFPTNLNLKIIIFCLDWTCCNEETEDSGCRPWTSVGQRHALNASSKVSFGQSKCWDYSWSFFLSLPPILSLSNAGRDPTEKLLSKAIPPTPVPTSNCPTGTYTPKKIDLLWEKRIEKFDFLTCLWNTEIWILVGCICCVPLCTKTNGRGATK